jgi:hypothetical protein
VKSNEVPFTSKNSASQVLLAALFSENVRNFLQYFFIVNSLFVDRLLSVVRDCCQSSLFVGWLLVVCRLVVGWMSVSCCLDVGG